MSGKARNGEGTRPIVAPGPVAPGPVTPGPVAPGPDEPEAVAAAEARWNRLVLYCGKCARKAGDDTLRHDLKKALKARGQGKRVRIVETGCLDVCPKHGVTIFSAPNGRLGVLLPDADRDAAVEWLVPGDGPQRK